MLLLVSFYLMEREAKIMMDREMDTINQEGKRSVALATATTRKRKITRIHQILVEE